MPYMDPMGCVLCVCLVEDSLKERFLPSGLFLWSSASHAAGVSGCKFPQQIIPCKTPLCCTGKIYLRDLVRSS